MLKKEEHEHILLTRHKHLLVLIAELLPPAILAFLPFVIYPLLAGQEIIIGEQIIVIDLRPAVLTFLSSAWLLILWMRAVGIWTDYYLDVWIVTDKRIVDREQKGFFHRQTSILRLERIQDVTIETRGLLATFFHFGDIHVQSAGETREFIMKGISNPQHAREIILEAQDRVTEHSPVPDKTL